MPEKMSLPAVDRPVNEPEIVRQERIRNKERLAELEKVRALWISSIEELESRVPHDDVLVDKKTYSYHVLRNSWLHRLMELDELQQEIEDWDRVIEAGMASESS